MTTNRMRYSTVDNAQVLYPHIRTISMVTICLQTLWEFHSNEIILQRQDDKIVWQKNHSSHAEYRYIRFNGNNDPYAKIIIV